MSYEDIIIIIILCLFVYIQLIVKFLFNKVLFCLRTSTTIVRDIVFDRVLFLL